MVRQDYMKCQDCGVFTEDWYIWGYEDDGTPIILCDDCFEVACAAENAEDDFYTADSDA